MVSGFQTWRDLEKHYADFVLQRRRAKHVQRGLIYTSYFFVLELVESMQERYGTQVHIPDEVFRTQLMYDSLLLHHSMFGMMHVQKKTLQAMEQQLCSNAEAALCRLELVESFPTHTQAPVQGG
tara:strand:- start:69 stop:440 length:372 start_codon:yes stop_codon:yes gene_type:complete